MMQKARLSKIFVFMLGIFSLTTLACGDKEGGKVDFKTDDDKVSYSIGVQIGNSLKQSKLTVNTQMLKRAIDDVIADKGLALSDSQMKEVFDGLRTRQEEAMQKEVGENLKKASAFLAENAKKPGIKSLPDSLQYQIITEGSGPSPALTDTVSVNYTGTLIDGTEFDSSVKRGQPLEFMVENMIPGWVEIIPMMKKGAKWKVFIPPQLGYGERAMGTIPANSLLIFEIELLSIKKGK
jgi:FKBP-type peptidyl-prolyl cis-trans isomerase